MTESRPAYTDPLIDEVRQRRRELLAQHDNDLGKLFEAARKLQAEHPEKIRDHRRHKPGSPQSR
jgi:hypothetical protein